MKDFVDILTAESFQMLPTRPRYHLDEFAELNDASLGFANRLPQHFGGGKVVLEKTHHTVVADDNVAAGRLGLFLVVVAGGLTGLEGGHENVEERFLVDGDLDGDIEPGIEVLFVFGDDTAVFGVGFEGLGGNEAFEDGTDDEIGIPKETHEG